LNVGLPELAIIVMIILFLFGPDKITEIAKSLGRANREYQQALSGATELKSAATGEEATRPKSEEEKLIESAKQLGIETDGKTVDEISREILEKTSE
jgi:sec-independent protein translocase protein TatA